jgi:amidase
LRIGVLPAYSVASEDVEQAVQPLFDAGAEGDYFELPGFDYVWVDELTTSGFRLGLQNYLAATGNPTIQSVADVIAFNDTDPDNFAPYGEDLLWASADSGLEGQEITDSMNQLRADMRAYLDSLMDQQNIDIIVSTNAELAGEYGIAGYPAITVPAGYQQESDAPFGLTFVGRHLADETVIAAAYAYEQATRARRPPILP